MVLLYQGAWILISLYSGDRQSRETFQVALILFEIDQQKWTPIGNHADIIGVSSSFDGDLAMLYRTSDFPLCWIACANEHRIHYMVRSSRFGLSLKPSSILLQTDGAGNFLEPRRLDSGPSNSAISLPTQSVSWRGCCEIALFQVEWWSKKNLIELKKKEDLEEKQIQKVRWQSKGLSTTH